MRQYEVVMHDGSKKYIHANNLQQARDRIYLMGNSAKTIQPIFNNGGKGQKKRV